ncbi:MULTISPECIES: zf-HC2 domain-containing protein [Streptomyces]|uniref:zf-HC2 domain-containing protein n=1 Tax=Streptomyces TaxID=1883 RepID=UPI00068F40B1|nr:MULTISPECIES: zf-HC2 domain-containing protein [Streptomyces]
MRCAQFRTALSARLDGEPSGLPDTRLDKHVARCTGCREWLARAERLSGQVRAAAADGPSAEWSARLLTGLSAQPSTGLSTGLEGRGPEGGQEGG